MVGIFSLNSGHVSGKLQRQFILRLKMVSCMGWTSGIVTTVTVLPHRPAQKKARVSKSSLNEKQTILEGIKELPTQLNFVK